MKLYVGILCIAILMSSGFSVSAAKFEPFVGHEAPNFSLKDIDGQTVTLLQLRGNPVMLNFWATWCPSCREEMPEIQKAFEKYGRDVHFVGVDVQESAETVGEFVAVKGYGWRFELDSRGKTAEEYLVKFIPTTFFIDAEGIIRKILVGPMKLDQIETSLQRVLEVSPPTADEAASP